MVNESSRDSATVRHGPAVAARRRSELPSWLWLWFPLGCLLVILWTRNFAPDFYARWILYEDGLVENGTAVAAFAATAVGLVVLRHRRHLPAPWLKAWMLALTGGCFYFGMEEISWGQQWFHWETPGWIAAFNDQRETNLHNTSGLLDQLPRNLLMLWVVIGGIVAPLWTRLRGGGSAPSRHPTAMFWPTAVCLPTAVLAIAIRTPDYLLRLGVPMPLAVGIDFGEVKEFYYALFLLIYLLSVYARLGEGRPTATR